MIDRDAMIELERRLEQVHRLRSTAHDPTTLGLLENLERDIEQSIRDLGQSSEPKSPLSD